MTKQIDVDALIEHLEYCKARESMIDIEADPIDCACATAVIDALDCVIRSIKKAIQ